MHNFIDTQETCSLPCQMLLPPPQTYYIVIESKMLSLLPYNIRIIFGIL